MQPRQPVKVFDSLDHTIIIVQAGRKVKLPEIARHWRRYALHAAEKVKKSTRKPVSSAKRTEKAM